MEAPSIIIIIIFSILMLLGIIIIGLYSRLSYKRDRVIDKFQAVDECINDRRKLMSRVAAIVESPEYHEDTLALQLDNLNDEMAEAINVNSLITYINKSKKLLDKALKLEEIHTDLKTNSNYISIKAEYEKNETKILYAIDIYNEEAKKYNEYKEKKIINIISKLFRFKTYDYYKK